MSSEDRRAELAARLAKVRARIVAACEEAGRSRQEITLIAVTKTFPASDVAALARLGVRDVGENRDQEAALKAVAVAASGVDVRWHFVGQLQSNKCRSVATYADMVHSVDRLSLVTALDKAAARRGRPLDVLVQACLDPDDGPKRGGLPVPELPSLAAEVAARDGLRLVGVMAVAPLGADPAPAYRRLAEASGRLRETYPEAAVVSAGMTGDFEIAIRHGATHLRIGSALLGGRPPLG